MAKMRCLEKLIGELANDDSPPAYFIKTVAEYESKLHLYLIEKMGLRTILRFGPGREITLQNDDFRADLDDEEWHFYMRDRRRACTQVFVEMLNLLQVEFRSDRTVLNQ